MSKEELAPVDLGHLEDKAVAIKNYFDASHDDERSEEYRAYMLKKAESVASSLVADFRYILDTYTIGGMEPYGLSESEKS